MSEADPSELRRSRGISKGQVTRMSQKFTKMKTHTIDEYDLTTLTRWHSQLEKADRAFLADHEDLCTADPDMTLDQYNIELEDHQAAVDAANISFTMLKFCLKIKFAAKGLEAQMKTLEACMAGGYDSSHGEVFTRLTKLFEEFQNLVIQDGASEHPDVLALDQMVSDRWIALQKIRSESGYFRPPPPPPSTLSASSTSVSGVAKVQALSVALPTFSGKTTEFREFKRLFLSILERQLHLSEDEKKALFLKSMSTPDSKEQARIAMLQAPRFSDAMAFFSERHENCREVVAHHLQELHRMSDLDQNADDVEKLIQQIAVNMNGIVEAKCLTSGQLMVAYADTHFKPLLRTAWRTATAKMDVPPDISHLQAFARSQLDIVSKPIPMEPLHQTKLQQPKRRHNPTRKHDPKMYIKKEQSSAPYHSRSPSPPPVRTVFQANKARPCAFCQDTHNTFACAKFKALNPQERQDWVKTNHRCFNCLGDKHLVADCKSEKRCQECKSSHHTLLHLPKWNKSKPSSRSEVVDCVATSLSSDTGAPITAMAQVSAGRHRRWARIMFDTGAEVTLISREFANSLDAPHLKLPPMQIGGVGSTTSPYAIRLSLHGDEDMEMADESISLNARVLDSLPQPTYSSPKRDIRSLSFLEGCTIADPDYGPGAKVDIILDNVALHHCRTGETRKGPDKGILADRTMFGWTIGGRALAGNIEHKHTPQVLVTQSSNDRLSQLMEQQWTDPELPGDHCSLSREDAHAEQTFEETCRKIGPQRYEVGMPVLENPPALGESKMQAIRRYRAVEKSLRKKGQWDAYHAAVLDFVKTGHAEKVPEEDLQKPSNSCYYMPMHCVCRESSSSTKIRPVCDASAASSSGASYNDTLAVGPCSYHPLPSILTRFRDSAVAMTADVSKMYRQVSLRMEDRDYHRFVFELVPGTIQDFRMTRVTFGVKASPYVATKVLQRIADDQQEAHPAAAKALKTSFYVDDVLTGASTLQEALHLRTDLNEALDSGGMPLCKWRSNSVQLLNSIPPNLRETSDLQLNSSPSTQHKALGLHWSTTLDDLHVSTPPPPSSSSVTKRQLVSITAQIFDPLGWFSPAVMMPRILTQEAWKAGAKWDDPLPNNILLTWQGWLAEMPSITLHPIHRPYGCSDQNLISRELHGFSDASERGFGGAVYLRSEYESGARTVDLVIAKGKVAPIQPTTIPRLELRGAVVLSILLHAAASDLNIPDSKIHAWSDSMVVLGWLSHSPSKLAVYVGNRIQRIKETAPSAQWHHVPGQENPADCLSRGLRPDDLCQFRLWWKGPEWLALDEDQWPQHPQSRVALLPEMRKNVLTNQNPVQSLGHDHHDHFQWVRVVGWIRRFLHNFLHVGSPFDSTFLSSQELQEAERCVLRASQRRSLLETIQLVQAGRPLPKTNHLRRLDPFMDDDGLLKVGGRLGQSDLPTTAVHPIILHGKDHAVRRIVDDLHRRMLHPPLSALLATISYSYHIPRLRPVLKSITHECLTCQRKWAKPVRQKMGDLPAVRCSRSQVFSNIGIDYAGPVYVTSGRGRGYSRKKTYVAVFVCMLTKAVHLEIAQDATTKAFLAALDRFCGRRGAPGRIFSDNGGNFHGANTELKTTLKELHSDEGRESVCRWSSKLGIEWTFQPAYAPNFGGLWEAGVKAMKGLIRDSLHHLSLQADELLTIIIAAEAVLNSRPYIPIFSTDPDGICPLTPGHFIVGKPLRALPQRVNLEDNLQNVRRWELVKRMEHQLWTQFRKQVLTQMSARGKDLTTQRNLKVHDVVLVSNQETRRNEWPLGLVTAVYPGPDGLVRAADVRVGRQGSSINKTSTSLYRRSARHLVLMPVVVADEESTSPSSSVRGSMSEIHDDPEEDYSNSGTSPEEVPGN